MTIYNTTILVAGIQLLVLLDDQQSTEANTYTVTAVNNSFTEPYYYVPPCDHGYCGALMYYNKQVSVDVKSYILQSIMNNSLIGEFRKGVCGDYGKLVISGVTKEHIVELVPPFITAILGGHVTCLFVKSIISELRQKEYTAQIADLQSKLANLEERTNYVENNRAWW